MMETINLAIKAVAGQPIGISAQISDENTGESVKEKCCLMLHSDTDTLYCAIGLYLEQYDLWQFEIPAAITAGLEGRYWYCIQYDGNNLCFKQPLYLVG